jgi:anti-sigma regulatory factor (Ser/Thr protein kinase)
MDIVRLRVPATLLYRDVVLRVVGSVCRLARRELDSTQNTTDRVVDFEDKVVSAVSEAFNNVVMHAYGSAGGDADLELAVDGDRLVVRLLDTGRGFDLSLEAGQDLKLETLRESHMGLELILACMDDVSYARGSHGLPNVLTMTKSYFVPSSGAAPPKSP